MFGVTIRELLALEMKLGEILMASNGFFKRFDLVSTASYAMSE